MMTPRRIVLSALGPASDIDAARVLDQIGTVVAVVAGPVEVPDFDTFRDAVVAGVLEADFGETVLAGVAFAPQWGGDAVGFT